MKDSFIRSEWNSQDTGMFSSTNSFQPLVACGSFSIGNQPTHLNEKLAHQNINYNQQSRPGALYQKHKKYGH